MKRICAVRKWPLAPSQRGHLPKETGPVGLTVRACKALTNRYY